MDLDDADFFPFFVQGIHGFLNGVRSGTHDDDNALGIFGAVVLYQFILATGKLAEFVHLFLDDLDTGRIKLVDRFTTLEVNVRVLCGTAHFRPVRGESAQAVGIDQAVINHGAHVIKSQLFNFLDFM